MYKRQAPAELRVVRYCLDVIFRSRPLDEVLCSIYIRGSCWNRHRPCPKPVRPDWVTSIWRLRVSNTVNFQEGGRDCGVDPHAAFAFVIKRQDFVEGVAFGAWRAIGAQQIYVEVDRSFPLVAVQRWTEVFVKPCATE